MQHENKVHRVSVQDAIEQFGGVDYWERVQKEFNAHPRESLIVARREA